MKRSDAMLIAAGAALIGGLFWAERKRPLRRQTRRLAPRIARNVAMGVMCMAIIEASEKPATELIARGNVSKRRGLAHWLPHPFGPLAGFLAMDYGFYLWHVATHKVPLLWRLHRVHHVDPDMDMTTALRFHLVDMLVSLPWRLVQVRVSGIGPRGLAAWRGFFSASVLFHHANLDLGERRDRRLSWLLTTPRMHGIHHSAVEVERDSNWSSGISWWDRLHGTLRQHPPARDLRIGVNDAEAEDDVALEGALRAPFK